MGKRKRIIRVYTGTEVKVNLLKEELEKDGITSIIRNDFHSGVSAGFTGGVSSAIDLYVKESDRRKAESFIAEFIRINKEQAV